MASDSNTLPPLDNPLWQSFLRDYERPEVARHCLSLQNQWGASVNRLLLESWAWRNHQSVQQSVFDSDSLTSHWASVAKQCRRQRQSLTGAKLSAAQQRLRKTILKLELLAEQHQIARLWQIRAKLLSPVIGNPSDEAGSEIDTDKKVLGKRLLQTLPQYSHHANPAWNTCQMLALALWLKKP